MAITVNNPTSNSTVTLPANITGSFSDVAAGVVDAEGTVGAIMVKFKFHRTDAGATDVNLSVAAAGSTFTMPMTAGPLQLNATYSITPTVTDGKHTITGTLITGVKTK